MFTAPAGSGSVGSLRAWTASSAAAAADDAAAAASAAADEAAAAASDASAVASEAAAVASSAGLGLQAANASKAMPMIRTTADDRFPIRDRPRRALGTLAVNIVSPNTNAHFSLNTQILPSQPTRGLD